jgi:hypothetical protein
MGNITDDGLVARFMVAHCEKNGKGLDRDANEEAVDTYQAVIMRLVELEPEGEIETFTFAPSALCFREAICEMAETMKCLPDTSDALKAHLNKFEGMFCRLALVYHMIESATVDVHPPPQIPEETARMAATLMAEFLFHNSVRFYAETIDDGSHTADARWVAGYILDRGSEVITKRELIQAYHTFRRDHKALHATMNLLYAANWVEEAGHKRDREVTSWAVNPAVHTKFKKRAKLEHELRQAERKKIQQAVRKLRKAKE